ncbi:MAG: alpha/beta hydrolase [Gammaproteobacteria bacterium]|nr:alpha/beta hydrolase [Gammaproteobacteria bacterium]
MHKIILFFSVIGISGCTAFFFLPLEKHYYSPSDLDLDYQDVYFSSLDGTRLHGWWLPAMGEATGSVLFLHGNAENISTHIGNVMFLPPQGLNVFLLDYRGYGRSEGTAYLEGLLMDVEAGLGQLLVHDKTDNLAVFGQSLGAALAILVAAESSYKEDIAVLVADSSFTSFREITREKLSNHWLTWLFQWPLAMTVEDDYRPIDEISKLHPTAVILVHSKADLVVPFHHGESLYNTAREPKNFWVTQNSVHNGFFSKLENQTALARRIKVWFK